jgi:hypothetical protein
VRLAASKMTGANRRAFQAEMTWKYCAGNVRQAEPVLGWGRSNIAVGLAEQRPRIICLGLPSAFSGRQRWADVQPEAAVALREIAEAQAQQAPTCRSAVASTRLTAQAAVAALRQAGDRDEPWPAASTMAVVRNRMGYRRRNVRTAKPQKHIEPTAAIFDHSKKRGTGRALRPGPPLEHGRYSDGASGRCRARGPDPGRSSRLRA